MPSPFPGMNPYLEQDDAWHSFHEQFITLMMRTIVPQVRPDYIVKVDEHFERQNFLEIRDRRSRKVVTVIELLSPSNKLAGPDRDQYLAKRRRRCTTSVHLVEIDLLRGGPRLPIRDLPSCDYYIMVSDAKARPKVGIWPLQLRDALPTIPIPLNASDRQAKLDMQELLHQAYDEGAYEDYIYEGVPQPALHPNDLPWAQELLKDQ